jgi:hypothetical protein
MACNNLGLVLEQTGDLQAAARALVQGLGAFQRVERDVGAHDDQRVSLFEQQQNTYRILQSVLLGLGQPEWALGVAAQAKARALLYHLAAGRGEHRGEHDASSGIAPDSVGETAGFQRSPMAPKPAATALGEAELKEMREIFAMFDEDGSGSIDAAELGGVLDADYSGGRRAGR